MGIKAREKVSRPIFEINLLKYKGQGNKRGEFLTGYCKIKALIQKGIKENF